MKKKGVYFIFLLFFVAICWSYKYDKAYHYGPFSTHTWRQADGASLAYNYYQDGLPFFKPRLHNQFIFDDQTVGECTIVYYLGAILYSIFEPFEGLLRLSTLLFVLAGLFAFFDLLYRVSGHVLYSLMGSLLLFTSPILGFYGFNFLPDPAAFGLQLLFIWGLYRWRVEGPKVFYWIAIGAISLAGAIKITALTPYLAYLLALGYQYLKTRDWAKVRREVHLPWIFLPVFLSLVWYLWAFWYNSNHTAYYLMHIRPIWESTWTQITQILHKIYTVWMHRYFSWPGHITFFVLGAIMIWRWRKIDPLWRHLTVFSILGIVGIFCLWFHQFKDHDYYPLTFLFVPALFLLFFGEWYKSFSQRWKESYGVVLFLVLLLSWINAFSEVRMRFSPQNEYIPGFNYSLIDKIGLQHFYEHYNIEENSLALSLPDGSPCMTLYWLKMRGWTQFNHKALKQEIPNYEGRDFDTEFLSYLADRGCQYLIINDKKWLDHPGLQEGMSKLIGVFQGSIYFYDISHLKKRSE